MTTWRAATRSAFAFLIVLALPLQAAVWVGTAETVMTPPIGTPSAGYAARQGKGMTGTRDELLATAIVLDTGITKIALCGVDNLGFTYDMVQAVREGVHKYPDLDTCHIYIGSSHTHSGGGAFLDIPIIGEYLAGAYDAIIRAQYVEATIAAIVQAHETRQPAKVGFGHGAAPHLHAYRALYPQGVMPPPDLAVIKITTINDIPLAVLFNYAVHPTTLKASNMEFSADFVGESRRQMRTLLGNSLQPVFFNGAQGELIPRDGHSCEHLGEALAHAVQKIWDETKTSDQLDITSVQEPYSFRPQATPGGMLLPIEEYQTELGLLVFNDTNAFVAVPGELSCLYDAELKSKSSEYALEHISILGLTNDAHGYMIKPEAWDHPTYEAQLSFGGRLYGDLVAHKIHSLLKDARTNSK